MKRRSLTALLGFAALLARTASADAPAPAACLADVDCTVTVVDDALKAKLAASKYKDLVAIRFRKDVTQSQFATLAKLPWLQTLDISASKGIVDLSPIAGFTALRALSIEATAITDYQALATLTSLNTVFLAGPTISSLSPLGGLTKLERLQLGGDLDVDVDLSPLASCASLKTLRLEHDRWRKLEAVTQLDTLSLDLSTTPNLDFASKMTKLRELSLTFPSALEKIATLNVPTLEVLSLTGADELRDVSGLSGVVGLKKLVLGAPRVASIASLAKLAHLESVAIGRTHVTDLTPLLASASSLRSLTVPWGTTAVQLAPFKKANPAISISIAEPLD